METPLYFDIETIGNPDAVSLLGPVKAAGNLKDPAKIAADLADKEAKRAERAALDCDTARIVKKQGAEAISRPSASVVATAFQLPGSSGAKEAA